MNSKSKKSNSWTKRVDSQLADHERRILALEKQFASNSTTSKRGSEVSKKSKYTGPTGGVRFLIDNGFFKITKDLSVVREELKKNDYVYPTKSIDSALRRLSKKGGPLVVVRESGRKVYVDRK